MRECWRAKPDGPDAHAVVAEVGLFQLVISQDSCSHRLQLRIIHSELSEAAISIDEEEIHVASPSPLESVYHPLENFESGPWTSPPVGATVHLKDPRPQVCLSSSPYVFLRR